MSKDVMKGGCGVKLRNLGVLPSYEWVLVCIISRETLICYGGENPLNLG